MVREVVTEEARDEGVAVIVAVLHAQPEGWGGAYHSTYWVDPVEELVVVYLTQLIPAGGLDDQGRLRALIYQAIED